MKALRYSLILISALFYSTFCLAQNSTEVATEQATGMRADGKIYVVIAIVLTILFILIAYLAIVDRKISRLEKENK
ncbi:MAG: CcmD family protein [Chitinophagaceae bacterium]